MTKTPLEKLVFIILTFTLLYFCSNKCTTQKKIDYKNNPHYPYVIEKIKK